MSPAAKTVHAWLRLVERFSEDGAALAAVLHPDYVHTELPNAMSPRVRERGVVDTLSGLMAGRQTIEDQRIEVTRTIESGSTVVVEAAWRGTLKVDAGALRRGDTLSATICIVFDLADDGRILRQRNYDCYDPLPTVAR
jgi:ketosteroid isomerase-like protein